LLVETWIDRPGIGREQQRVAVRLGSGGVAEPDIAAGAADILDDECLAGRLLQRRGNDAADDVRGSAGCVRDDDFDRTIGIGGIGRAYAQERRRRGAGGECARALDDAATRRRRMSFGSCHCPPLSFSDIF